jgi:NitT/TauT family transport system permease protein
VAIVGLFLLVWEKLSESQVIDPLFFSSPSAIGAFLVQEIASPLMWSGLLITLRETALAFFIGSLLGVTAGLLRISFRFLAAVTDPFVTVLNALPRVALAPMFIIWFGIGEPSKVVLGISLVFFIMMINAESGARAVDQEYITAVRALGGSRLQLFRMVLLPGAVAAIFGGLRLAVVYSMTGVVFGEMLAAKAGLGHQLQFYANTFRTEGVFGMLLILAVVALAINAMVLLLERRLLAWRG